MDEKIRLVLETLGADSVRQAVKALRELETATEDLGGEIRSGLVKANGELLLTLKDGQRVTADSAEGFRKLLDQQGKFFVTLSNGQRKLMDADDAMREASNALLDYQNKTKAATAATDDFADELEILGRSIKDGVEQPMERFLVTLKNGQKVWNDSAEGIRHLGGVVGRKSDFGQRMLETSYLVDDMQYGFRGIVNNIPQFARTFGISTAAVGAFGIAAVGVNQALAMIGPLFEDTNKPAKDFGETIGTFAKSSEIGKVQVEELGKQVEKLAKSFSPGLLESVDATLDRMDKLVEKQKTVIEQNEKIQQQQADIAKTEKAMKEASKDKRGALAEEYFQGAGPAGQKAAVNALSPEFRDQAKRDIVQNRLSMLESTGQIKTDWQREFARNDIEKNLNPADIDNRARELSMAAIGAAGRGDKAGIERMARMDPNFAAFIEGDAADQQFEQGLTSRSGAIRRRNERNAQRDAQLKKNLIDSGLKVGRPGGFDDEIAIQQGRAAAGPKGGPVEFLEANAPLTAEPTPEQIEAMRQSAEIRNAVLQQMDPTQMAALRNAQAGMGPFRGRNLQQLRGRDMRLFSNALMEKGMGRGEAQQAAIESLGGGEQGFEQFAESIGKNLENGLRAQEASQEFFRMMQMRMDEFAMRQEMLMQQFNMLGGQGQTTARPPSRVRN